MIITAILVGLFFWVSGSIKADKRKADEQRAMDERLKASGKAWGAKIKG